MGPGVIVVPTANLTRYPAFWGSLMALQRPAGSVVSLQVGHSVAQNVNLAIRDSLLPNPEFQWAWLLSDDHVFAPDTLMRLLTHDVDIVVALTLSRSNGQPVIHKTAADGRDRQVMWSEVPEGDGLIQVDGCGGSGMLVKREVFARLGYPWYRLGAIVPDSFCEDLDFCHRVKALGYSIYVDPMAVMGHITSATLWPGKSAEGWGFSIDLQTRPGPPAPDPGS